MRKFHLAAITSATLVTVMLLVFAFPYTERLPKTNFYTKDFTDSKYFTTVQAIIYYETEDDGTWHMGYFGYKNYNITVFLKPIFINTTTVAMLHLLQCIAGVQYQIADMTWADGDIDLFAYWANNSAWLAVSMEVRASSINLIEPDRVALSYHFVVRAIYVDGTHEDFVADDTISIPITAYIK